MVSAGAKNILGGSAGIKRIIILFEPLILPRYLGDHFPIVMLFKVS